MLPSLLVLGTFVCDMNCSSYYGPGRAGSYGIGTVRYGRSRLYGREEFLVMYCTGRFYYK